MSCDVSRCKKNMDKKSIISLLAIIAVIVVVYKFFSNVISSAKKSIDDLPEIPKTFVKKIAAPIEESGFQAGRAIYGEGEAYKSGSGRPLLTAEGQISEVSARALHRKFLQQYPLLELNQRDIILEVLRNKLDLNKKSYKIWYIIKSKYPKESQIKIETTLQSGLSGISR